MLRLILLAFKAKLKGRVCKCVRVFFFKCARQRFIELASYSNYGIHFANVSVNTDTAYISLLPRLVSSIIYNN